MSSVNEPEVNDWLEKQKDVYNNTPEIDSFIENVASNLNFEKIMKEDYGDGEYIISIPVSGHLSMHDKSEKTLTFLVVFEDNNGEIRRGELALFDDDNNSIDSLSMYDLYLDNPLSDDEYSVKLVSLQDYMFVDKTMSKEHLKIYNSYYGKAVMDKDNCMHWYWLHVDYNTSTGELLDFFIVDLGCLSCPPNALCSSLDGGGGGGVSTSEIDQNTLKPEMCSYSFGNYKARFYTEYVLSGIRNPNPSLSTFYGIDYNGTSSTLTPNHAMLPNSRYYYIPTYQRNNEICQATSVIGNINVVLRFPNIDNNDILIQGTHEFFPADL